MVAADTFTFSLYRIRESSMFRIMVSRIVVTVAKNRKLTTATSSLVLPAAMTVPVRIWFSFGIRRPTSAMAPAATRKEIRSRGVRQASIYFSRSFSFSSRMGRGR